MLLPKHLAYAFAPAVLAGLAAVAVALLFPTTCRYEDHARDMKTAFVLTYLPCLALCAYLYFRDSNTRLRSWALLPVSGILAVLAWWLPLKAEASKEGARIFRTYLAMRAISTQLRDILPTLRSTHPPAPGAPARMLRLADLGLGVIPTMDGWGNDYLVILDASGYWLISRGACGALDVEDPRRYRRGWNDSLERDIVVWNHQFVQYPEGIGPGDMLLTRDLPPKE